MKEKINIILKSIRPEFEFSEIDDFFKAELLDSFDIIALVSELEKEFNVRIKGTDIVFENFCNIQAIEKLLKKSGIKS